MVPCPTPARPPSREGGGPFSPDWLSNSFSSCKVGVDLGHSGCESDDSGAENGGDGHGVVASPGATARTAVIADCRGVSSTGIRWLRRGGPVGRAAAVPTGARPDRKGMPQVMNPGRTMEARNPMVVVSSANAARTRAIIQRAGPGAEEERPRAGFGMRPGPVLGIPRSASVVNGFIGSNRSRSSFRLLDGDHPPEQFHFTAASG